MSILTISQVLKLDPKTILETLYSTSNDHDLDTSHVNFEYQGDGEYVNVVMTPKVLTEDMQPGRYTNTVTVRYRREALQVLFNGRPTFYITSNWPITFNVLQKHLKEAYGVWLETADFLKPITQEHITPDFVFEESQYINSDNTIELRVADNSPRFIPHSLGGDSIFIRVLDPNGDDLALIGPTQLLAPITSLDT